MNAVGPAVPAVVLARIPSGVPVAEDFAVSTVPAVAPTVGQLLVDVETISLDPYVRSLLGGSHLAEGPVPLGGVIPGRALARVRSTTVEAHPVGSLVLAETGWRAQSVIDAASAVAVTPLPGVPDTAALGALGMPGLTAYAAIERHLRPRPGDTVVIGAATGGVGSVAGGLARAAGARTIGIVGSEEKRRIALAQGYDAALVRGADGWADELAAVCPDRIDAYVHLGDQETLDVVMEQLAVGARVSLCGLMDQYNGAAATRLRAGAVMAARAVVHGMVVYDHTDLAAEHRDRVGSLLASGAMPLTEERHQGLASAPAAFAGLMAGRNVGKVVVDLGDRNDSVEVSR